MHSKPISVSDTDQSYGLTIVDYMIVVIIILIILYLCYWCYVNSCKPERQVEVADEEAAQDFAEIQSTRRKK